MKLSKKALRAAITLSLLLGVYGVAGATELYGATTGSQYLKADGSAANNPNEAAVVAADGKYVSTGSDVTSSGANYTVKNGVWNNVIGGQVYESGVASDNNVTICGSAEVLFRYIEGADNPGFVMGGYASESGAVSSNHVTISEDAKVSFVYGGYTDNGAASDNSVTIKGGTINLVSGGLSSNADACSNIITIEDGMIYGVYGGGANGRSGDAIGNIVTLKAGTVLGKVYGGSSECGNATGNNVTISGSATACNAYGGFSYNGNATGNNVTISGSAEVLDNTGYEGNVYGGWSQSGVASSNNVTIIESANVSCVYGGVVSYEGDVNSNQVTISGDANVSYVYGGVVSYEGDVSSNQVTISGDANVSYVYGGVNVGEGAATNNQVTISGGTITGEIYGGFAYGTSGDAINNIVTLTDGTVRCSVYGGYSASGAATNNVVNVQGTVDLCGANLYGYDPDYATGTHEGNALNIDTAWTGGNNTVKSIQYFDTLNLHTDVTVTASMSNVGALNFYVPVVYTDAEKNPVAMLTAKSAVDLSGVTVNIDTKNVTSNSTVRLLDTGNNGITNRADHYQINGTEIEIYDTKSTGDLVKDNKVSNMSNAYFNGSGYHYIKTTGDKAIRLEFGMNGDNYYLEGDSTVSGNVTLNSKLEAGNHQITIDGAKSLIVNAGLETNGNVINLGTLTNNGTMIFNAGSDFKDKSGSQLINTGSIDVQNGATFKVTQLDNTKGRIFLPAAGFGTNQNKLYMGSLTGGDVYALPDAKLTSVANAANNDRATEYFTSEANAKNIIANGKNTMVHIGEGRVLGATDFVYDVLGKRTVNEHENKQNITLSNSLSNVAGFARLEANDIRKRLGDVRVNASTNSMWGRYESGCNEGMGVDQTFNKFQLGSDHAVSDKWRVGGAISYTKSGTDYDNGSNDGRTYSAAAYGLLTGKNGEFLDLIARVGLNKNDIKAATVQGSLNNFGVSVSAEVGRTYDLSKCVYVEPQAELTYTRTNGDDFTNGGVTYKLDDSNSFVGRVGFTLGYRTPENKGQLYTRFSLLHEFSCDTNLDVSDGIVKRTSTVEGKQSWLEWAIGGQFNTSKCTYVYVDAEKTFCADINEKYRVNVGLRYSF